MKTSSAADGRDSVLEMRCSWGIIHIVARDGSVVSCKLPELRSEPSAPFRWERVKHRAVSPNDAKTLKAAERFVKSVLKGQPVKPPAFVIPPATPFTLRVWRALQSIEPGCTVEYGELASRIGRAKGSRAVGRACGANPLPLFIPCHRVLPKDGSLGGFTGGLPWKRLLLERENAARPSS